MQGGWIRSPTRLLSARTRAQMRVHPIEILALAEGVSRLFFVVIAPWAGNTASRAAGTQAGSERGRAGEIP